MVLLERIGVFTIESYWSKWRVAVLVIAVVSMFLTPADPGSMLLMGCPLVVLYFGGILLCKYLPRHATPPHRQPK
jgi:sec-independent protein translocase protein TatC